MRGANGWYLQLDIQNFFNSINRFRLLDLLEKRIHRWIRGEEADLLFYLCRALLETDPTANVRFQGAPGERERVPPHKRLGAAGPNKGLPIGNLSSQFFANVYLNELDQYVKHVLKCRYYLRYVDDFILLHRDPEVLLDWKREIESFLEEILGLRLKPEYRLHPVANGADFLGYIVRPRYLLVRRRVVGHLREKLRSWEKIRHRSHAPRHGHQISRHSGKDAGIQRPGTAGRSARNFKGFLKVSRKIRLTVLGSGFRHPCRNDAFS